MQIFRSKNQGFRKSRKSKHSLPLRKLLLIAQRKLSAQNIIEDFKKDTNTDSKFIDHIIDSTTINIDDNPIDHDEFSASIDDQDEDAIDAEEHKVVFKEDLCSLKQPHIKELFQFFADPNELMGHLKSTLGGEKDDNSARTLIMRLVKFLVWTYYHKYVLILFPMLALNWMGCILDSEFLLVDTYTKHLETDNRCKPSTICNHLYDLIEAFKWSTMFNKTVFQMTKLTEMCSKICRSQSKKNRKSKSESKMIFTVH